jgi:two-component system, NarL family, nitrate/nitrite response regulator NarL
MPKSVLIVDDNELVRTVVRDFFGKLSEWKIVGEASDGVEAIRIAEQFKPDLILLDFSMPRLNGVEAASVLKKMLPRAYVVVFTIFDDALSSRLCLSAGVDVVVAKADGLGGLVKAVQEVVGIGGKIDGHVSPDSPATMTQTYNKATPEMALE